MAVSLSKEVQEFLRGKVYAHLATLMKDGSPQVTPVWVDTDGKNVLINTSTGRVKTRNIQRDARVAMSIMGMDSPYKTVWVRGKVIEITEVGANDHIDSLSARYTGNPKYQGHQPGVRRLKIAIEPLHVTARGL